MERVLSGLQPERYFYYFEEISRIPRSSYEEQAVSNYIVEFAKAHGLEYDQDADWNVIINKPATPGYENHKGIILQGHLDMVCVSEDGVQHDFRKDPIDLYVDGDWVKARGTTLGADNGTAIAMMLMLLEADDVEHPAIQCIFTTKEEIGLEGAAHLDPNKIQGDYLINLDGGTFTELLLSSAGTSNHLYHLNTERTAIEAAAEKQAIKITVSGLTGGHSGGLAHLCKPNAIKVLGDVLNELKEVTSYDLLDIRGGLKMNAIAIDAAAVVAVPKSAAEAVTTFAAQMDHTLKVEALGVDDGITLTAEPAAMPETAFSETAKEKLLAFLDLLFDGTYRFMTPEKQMAKTSCNIGILHEENGVLTADCLMRSNSEYEHKQLRRKADRVAKLIGIDHEVKNPSAAWEYDPASSLVKRLNEIYQEELGYIPEVKMTHGGMEPGVLTGLAASVGKKLEAMNMGVKCSGAHTTEEQMNIPSVAETWDWLKVLLRKL